MKDLLFLSHSNPGDNYFAAWLASKLKLLGFKVWADVQDIKGGDDFRIDIENRIRQEVIRFIPIVTEGYVSKATTSGSGVHDEIELARAIKDIPGFIIPVRLDNTPHNNFPSGILGKDAIDFSENWADGLNKLVTLLKETYASGKPKVPCSSTDNNPLQFWFDAQKITPGVIQKQELYRTNWFDAKLPQHIYIHLPELLDVDKLKRLPYSYVLEANRIISFTPGSTLTPYNKIIASYKYTIEEFVQHRELKVNERFVLKEPRKKLIKLLNQAFRTHMLSSGFSIYEQSKGDIFHLPMNEANLKRVSLKQFGKSGRALIGQKGEYNWHYAISHQAIMFPFPGFRIFYTIIFTDLNGKYLKKDEQHELRRSLPSDWYNRKWFEMLLAMMLRVSGFSADGKIKIDVDLNFNVIVDVMPKGFISDVGYNEPVIGKEKEPSAERQMLVETEKGAGNV